MKSLLAIIFCVSILAVNGNSQVVVASKPSVASKANVEYVIAGSAKVVKNAPFSAEAVSESIQTLSDGNRIVKKSTVKMYRDSEGRFRREGAGGGGTGSGGGGTTVTSVSGTGGFSPVISLFGASNSISIYDPVESVRYILYPSNKTARRYESRGVLTEAKIMSDKAAELKKIEKTLADKSIKAAELNYDTFIVGNGYSFSYSTKGEKPESLGTKMFEGVEAEGTRTVKTIAAGAIGNELPIEIVYEKWYSKELDLVVYSRNFDPRFGEQIYRLTNIDRSEPDSSLFTIPSDYKIVEEKLPGFYTKIK